MSYHRLFNISNCFHFHVVFYFIHDTIYTNPAIPGSVRVSPCPDQCRRSRLPSILGLSSRTPGRLRRLIVVAPQPSDSCHLCRTSCTRHQLPAACQSQGPGIYSSWEQHLTSIVFRKLIRKLGGFCIERISSSVLCRCTCLLVKVEGLLSIWLLLLLSNLISDTNLLSNMRFSRSAASSRESELIDEREDALLDLLRESSRLLSVRS